MNCDKARTLVAAYADGQIGGLRRRWSIEKHMRVCLGCATQHQEALELSARLRSELSYHRAPQQLRARVRTLLSVVSAAAPARPRPTQDRWRLLAGGALAGCVATVLAWVGGNAFLQWRTGQDALTEVVAAHTRATLSDHLIEVASADQHTVKPWLAARLDYSPPVPDLTSEGFVLIGGRLETLQKQRVATLVYRYRKHTIDVFVRPEPMGALAGPRTLRGFYVVQARGAEMDWLVVSDVSPDVLTALVQRLAHAESTHSDASW
jgi:anti-sigma factor RsiW